MAGLGWRVVVGIVTAFGLASFLLLFFAFWSGPMGTFQRVAVVTVATLVFLGANGASWAGWGMRYFAGALEEVA